MNDMTTDERIAAIQARHATLTQFRMKHFQVASPPEVDRGVLLDIVRDLTAERDRLKRDVAAYGGELEERDAEITRLLREFREHLDSHDLGGWCICVPCERARRALAGEDGACQRCGGEGCVACDSRALAGEDGA